PAPAAQVQTNVPARKFDIPSGPLDGALSAFHEVTGIEVHVRNPGLLMIMSTGVTGVFTPEQALQRLLRDTGVDFHFTSATEVNWDLQAVSSSVSVVATVEALAASTPKYGETVLDTPQTITAISQEVMQQQNTTTLRDALRNVAGISIAAGEGGA